MESKLLGEARLSRSCESVSLARSEVRKWLGWDHPAVEDVTLAVSELVTNAIIHSDRGRTGGLIGLTLTTTENLLRVEVSDPGSAFTAPHLAAEMNVQPSANMDSGRGLFIVNELSEGRWGTRKHGHGRTVWCAIAVSPSTSDPSSASISSALPALHA
ncbi:ATP-binding protein [Streptosporangium sp. NPDC000396]|uniref:ATP-binding protein n=1 Tax=Streptosporangium sp. NPDC000396 TaxID=3366185 RepID=UPI0036A98D6F